MLLEHGDLHARAREQQPEHHAGGPAASDDYARDSAAFTRSGLSGALRTRTPVAS